MILTYFRGITFMLEYDYFYTKKLKLHNPCDFEVLVVFQNQFQPNYSSCTIIDNLALSCLNVWGNFAL